MTDRAASLRGQSVVIAVSDPWEFADGTLMGTVAEVGPFSRSVDRGSVLVGLASPAVWRSTSYPSLLLQARQGEGIVDLVAGRDAVECNFVGLTPAQRGRPESVDMAGWRGGLAGMATMRLVG